MSVANLLQELDRSDAAAPPEFNFLKHLIKYRVSKYLGNANVASEPEMPDVQSWHLPMKGFILSNNLSKTEALALLVAVAPHVQPDLFDSAIESSLHGSTDFPKIGGARGKNFRGFMPTGQTLLFLSGSDDWKAGQEAQEIFWSSRVLGKKKVLWLEELPAGEPLMSGRIILSQDYIETFTFGKLVPPHFSMTFPAKLITTKLSWDDLVINDDLREDVSELLDWVKYNEELLYKWGMEKRLVKGYRALFYGPPGTGKTFTAGLIAKEMARDLYKIDLSMVVSKYIGETEKNLELLFARAEDKGWILFFDEADALFGKRTNVRDAHDKYANQEVSYLLQRIEDFNGLIILCTNMKNNMDDAFIRRFNCILKFPFPSPEERMRIWRNAFPENRIFLNKPAGYMTSKVHAEMTEEVDIPEMVRKYELSGGSIMNVAHYAGLKAVERSRQQGGEETPSVTGAHRKNGQRRLAIYLSDVLDGIRRELIKEGKPFSA